MRHAAQKTSGLPTKAASPTEVRMPSTNRSAMNSPSVAVVWIHEV